MVEHPSVIFPNAVLSKPDLSPPPSSRLTFLFKRQYGRVDALVIARIRAALREEVMAEVQEEVRAELQEKMRELRRVHGRLRYLIQSNRTCKADWTRAGYFGCC